MIAGMIAVLAIGAGGRQMLATPGFDRGLAGWHAAVGANLAQPSSVDGRSAASIIVEDGAEVGFPCLYQETAVKPGEVLEARVEAMGRDVRDGFGAYAALEFYDADEQRMTFSQSEAAPRDGKWTQLVVRAIAPEDCVKARFCLLLNGRGQAFFDTATLVRVGAVSAAPVTGTVTLRATDKVVCDPLIGFGAEDDGWFYSPENAGHGVTDEDIAIREARIKWMAPDWVRMFCWYKDWCPSGDWETFTFGSPNMRSHYRTLDLYQKIGARVNVTGVEWGMTDPYGQPERAARAIGALFEHLIKDKGYTCVGDWTLTNEPNGSFVHMGYDFNRFLELHRLVKREFEKRGLRVRIVGSDDTSGLDWFTRCVQDNEYYQTADLFSSHFYVQYPNRPLAPLSMDDRLALIGQHRQKKPFVIGEFGFQDARSGTLENPLMETYPYAVWTAAFVIEGLNRGVAGFSIWCLHEVYYPGGGFMNYGLWDFRDNGWKPRPVYHAWAMFSKLTKAGDTVRTCESSHPDAVIGSIAGDTLFWVNRSDQVLPVRISGLKATEVRIMTEATLEGDRECGTVEKLNDGLFTAPPQSFGYAR
ncbi:MAG: hypothetical protein JSV65_05700 [Armatimonadota bacterium]|nr:MAG: hypothetical protein JSV65_05700 [Armatimonadota bacterium]